jgi:hypothetical protein
MREINWDEPLSDEDKAWARQAGLPMVEQRILANEQQFGEPASAEDLDMLPDPARSVLDPTATTANASVATGETPGSDMPPDDDYDNWKVVELREEAATRTPPVEVASDARKPDIIAALREWDRQHPTE